MNSYSLEHLKQCGNIDVLKPALHSLCSRFGSVARLDVLTAMQAGKRQAICFLRMDSPAQEMLLMQSLGIGRFGGHLVVVVDLCSPNTGAAIRNGAQTHSELNLMDG